MHPPPDPLWLWHHFPACLPADGEKGLGHAKDIGPQGWQLLQQGSNSDGMFASIVSRAGLEPAAKRELTSARKHNVAVNVQVSGWLAAVRKLSHWPTGCLTE